MGEKFKSRDEAARLGAAIKERRLARGLTLKDVERAQKINRGQLSRIEAGLFKSNSPNLQKLCTFLQITYKSPRSLGERLEQFAARSTKHRYAAEELLNALEHLS